MAYAYDPEDDLSGPADKEDVLHDPSGRDEGGRAIGCRGVTNIAALVFLVLAMICLFVAYPVADFYSNNGRNQRITGNTRINSTGQAVEELTLGERDQLPFW